MGVPGRSRHVTVAVALAGLIVMLGLSGCFGNAQAVYIPDGALASGWSQVQDNQTESLAGGEVEVVMNEYRYSDSLSGRIFLIGATDVPVVSETKILREQIDEFARENGVTMTKTGSAAKTLKNGVRVSTDEYDIRKDEAWGEAKGKALVITHDAGDFFIGGIGYATTEYRAAGLLGAGNVQSDTSQWQRVQDMMLHVDW